MSKNRLKATIVGGVVAAGLLGGAGVVYATSGFGPDGCNPNTSTVKAIGPDGSAAADTTGTGGPLCVAPVAPVAPISR